MKHFIITVDTEGDNLWDYRQGNMIATNNSRFIPRFQELCESYGFKPVYLTNYEMINSDHFVNYIKPKIQNKLCEVGIHVHAWNNPPFYELGSKYNGNPFLIEYPNDIMIKKFKCTYDLIKSRLGIEPISHRAGRWMMNDEYFDILNKFKVKVDCSYTPHVDWSRTYGQTLLGLDYSNVFEKEHWVKGVLEMPMSIRKLHHILDGSFKHKIKTFLIGDIVWLRPATHTLAEMIKLVDSINLEENTNYIEMMIHSSELMPGGSPYFKNDLSIESLFRTMDKLFKHIALLDYKGCTLADYYHLKIE